MNRNPTTATRSRPQLPAWLAVSLLAVFLAVRGLVPNGFMPSAVSAGSLYQLCHGDARSALLLAGIAPPAHHQHGHHGQSPLPALPPAGHHHDDATAKHFSDNHCAFSNAGIAAVGGLEIYTGAEKIALPARWYAYPNSTPEPAFLTPPGRAPPRYS